MEIQRLQGTARSTFSDKSKVRGQIAMSRKETKADSTSTTSPPAPPLVWLKAAYKFHTYAYRDPRSAFASAMGSPVVSPTTVLLGIASTLFSLGTESEAKNFLGVAHNCRVVVDAPDGII